MAAAEKGECHGSPHSQKAGICAVLAEETEPRSRRYRLCRLFGSVERRGADQIKALEPRPALSAARLVLNGGADCIVDGGAVDREGLVATTCPRRVRSCQAQGPSLRINRLDARHAAGRLSASDPERPISRSVQSRRRSFQSKHSRPSSWARSRAPGAWRRGRCAATTRVATVERGVLPSLHWRDGTPRQDRPLQAHGSRNFGSELTGLPPPRRPLGYNPLRALCRYAGLTDDNTALQIT